jgi:hypothetical protein
MRQDDARQQFNVAQRRRDEALQQRTRYHNQFETVRQSRNRTQELNIQTNGERSNLEHQLEQIIVVLRLFEFDVPSVIQRANASANAADSAYHATIISADFPHVSLGEAFRTIGVEEDQRTNGANQDCRAERARIENEITRINAEITRLNSAITQMDADLRRFNIGISQMTDEARRAQHIMDSVARFR